MKSQRFKLTWIKKINYNLGKPTKEMIGNIVQRAKEGISPSFAPEGYAQKKKNNMFGKNILFLVFTKNNMFLPNYN